MTFSIAARCRSTGQFGVAVCSSSPCVASRCANTRAGVGAALSQNVTDPGLGPALLDAVEQGSDASTALQTVLSDTTHTQWRQLLLIDGHSTPVIHTGTEALGICAEKVGYDCVAAGNLLANSNVPDVMVLIFEKHHGESLADRLLLTLKAAVDAGGEAGPIHSAGLQVADRVAWPVIDLRVDWHDRPIDALGTLWDVYKPQVDDYVTRALDPGSSPAYGVPGDP